jgi:hypothetical protein
VENVFKTVHQHFVPSHKNSYRPHILRRSWLMFFIAVIFVSEGVFVSSVFVQQGGQTSVAAVAAAPAASSDLSSFANSFGRNLARIAVDSEPTVPWALGTIVVLLFIALLFTFFMHIQIQQPEMLFSGALVALFALSLIVTNVQITGML